MNSSDEDMQEESTPKDGGESEKLAKSNTFPGLKTLGKPPFRGGSDVAPKGAKPFLKIPPINIKPPIEQGTPPPFRPPTCAGILEGAAEADTEKQGIHAQSHYDKHTTRSTGGPWSENQQEIWK